MLKVITREVNNAKHMMQRPILAWNRKQQWPSSEASSIKLVNDGLTQFGYLQNDQGVTQNANSVVNYINHQLSKGNYVVDADGNTMLDLTSGDINPLGYNHDLFRSFAHGKESDNSIINGFASDGITSAGHQALVKETLGAVAPDHLDGITLVNGRNATEQAVQAAMIERSCDNTSSWSSWTALYFQGSTHGSPLTLGGMICGWPNVAYPSSATEES